MLSKDSLLWEEASVQGVLAVRQSQMGLMKQELAVRSQRDVRDMTLLRIMRWGVEWLAVLLDRCAVMLPNFE